MENIVSYLPKIDFYLGREYPDFIWSRVSTNEVIDKSNQNTYYEISYRVLAESGRWNALVIWEKGKMPILKEFSEVK
jgi:hypothetical protein